MTRKLGDALDQKPIAAHAHQDGVRLKYDVAGEKVGGEVVMADQLPSAGRGHYFHTKTDGRTCVGEHGGG